MSDDLGYRHPPDTLGTTIGFDSVILRSDQGAMILRSIVVHRRSLGVNIEISRAPHISDDTWVKSTRAIVSKGPDDSDSSSSLSVALTYSGGDTSPLEAIDGWADGSRLKIGFWGRLHPEEDPIGLNVTWKDNGDTMVGLPTAEIQQESTSASSIW